MRPQSEISQTTPISNLPDLAVTWPEADLLALRRAKQALESPSLVMQLAALVGMPVEKLIAKLPSLASDKVNQATQAALRLCLRTALKTLDKSGSGEGLPGEGGEHGASGTRWSDRIHKIAAATSGAAGGMFGLPALLIELPFTTTLMFRSICDIARSEGEDLSNPGAQLQCLTVFGMGGRSPADDEADVGYFAVRGMLAQMVSNASSEIAAKGFSAHGSTALVRLMHTIAARFSVQVSQQAAAKLVPAIGAVAGALVNTAFMDHFQQVAHGHFTVRRLERRHGEAAVAAVYKAIDAPI